MADPSPELERLVRWHFARRDAGACPREIDLARFAAGDDSPEERAQLQGHLDGCMECRLDLQRFETDVREHPLETGDKTRARSRLASIRVRWIAAVVAAAAALLMLLKVFPLPDVLHPKGHQSFQLVVAAARNGQVVRVQDGTRVEPGDRLGFFYSAEREGYLMIWYASETEAVRIFPAAHAGSERVPPGSELPLRDGATLTPGTGCEWIIGVFSGRPLADADARAVIEGMVARRSACRLTGPSGGEVATQVVGVGR